MKDLIDDWYKNKEDEFINALSSLIEIDSTKSEPLNDAPFGRGPKLALEKALQIADSWGFETENIDNYVGTVDLNKNDDRLHILAHLDVVGIGDGWNTNPFKLVRNGDTIYGRGVDDDKGPAIAALFALKCVKQLNLPLNKNVKLIFGTDEESGSSDIAYYYKYHPYAPNTVTPDAEFPVINIEKGHYTPIFKKSWKDDNNSSYIVSLDGGIRTNVAPGKCVVKITGIDEDTINKERKILERKIDIKFDVIKKGNCIEITANGMEAHASTPDEGSNAITGLLDLLASLPFDDSEQYRLIKSLNTLFPYGDNEGRALGINNEDEISGKLTLTLSMLHIDKDSFWGQFDVRCPLSSTYENLVKATENKFNSIGCTCEGEKSNVHFVDENDIFIKTILESYEKYSNKKGYCMAIGGGTYVHDIPGGVAFGAGDVEYDSRLHSANERARISQLIMSSKIYADMIIKLCS